MKTLVSYIKSDNAANIPSCELLGKIVEYFIKQYMEVKVNRTPSGMDITYCGTELSKFMLSHKEDLFFPEDGLENYKGVELAIVWSRLVIKIAKAQKNKEAEELFSNFLKELEK